MEDISIEKSWREKKYHVNVDALVSDGDLLGQTEFECHMVLPDTPFQMSEMIQYEPSKLSYKDKVDNE